MSGESSNWHNLMECWQEEWVPCEDEEEDGRQTVVLPGRPGAEQGEEFHALTVRGTQIQRSGAIPEALDPARLFRPEDTELDCELRVLEALHTDLGLSVPRFTLTQGRLHTFTTRSWTRAPCADEGFAYAYVGHVRHRP